MKHHFLFLVLACCVLAGCHSKLDLTNIDSTSQIELGVVMPLGTFRATLADFLGNGEVDRISVDENTLFHFIDTVDLPTKTYHHINVANYIIKDTSTLEFPIAEKLPPFTPNPIPVIEDLTIPLKFDMNLGLQGFNTDTTDERIDSIWVTEATFISHIGKTDDLGMRWEDIERVVLVLDPQQFTCAKDTIEIPVEGYDFDDDIEINVQNFTLNLMKDKHNTRAGMVDNIHFEIIFFVHPKQEISYTEDSKFNYNLQVKVIDYKAIWGFFEAGNDTRDARMINMDSLWDEWKNLKKLKVRLAKPSVELHVSHKVAAPLRMHVEELYALDSTGRSTYATWDGDRTTTFDLKKSLSPEPYTIGDSIENSEIFNEHPAKGHIDNLFEVRPDSFYYSFRLIADRNLRPDYPWKQHRLTKDSVITGYAIIDIPFAFKDSSEAAYEKTFNGVSMSKLTLDSLLGDIDQVDSVKEGSLKCNIHIKNYIPFTINGKFSFLDGNGQKLSIHVLDSVLENVINIPAPKISKPSTSDGYGTVMEPSTTDLLFHIKQEEFDKFTEVKSIHMDATLKDNPQRCTIDSSTCMTVNIAIAATIEALVHANKNKDNDK